MGSEHLPPLWRTNLPTAGRQ